MRPSENTYVMMSWHPQLNAWGTPVIHSGDPLRRVKELLHGPWTRSDGDLIDDMSSAFWNSKNGYKVFVLRMPVGLPIDAVRRIAEAA